MVGSGLCGLREKQGPGSPGRTRGLWGLDGAPKGQPGHSVIPFSCDDPGTRPLADRPPCPASHPSRADAQSSRCPRARKPPRRADEVPALVLPLWTCRDALRTAGRQGDTSQEGRHKGAKSQQGCSQGRALPLGTREHVLSRTSRCWEGEEGVTQAR